MAIANNEWTSLKPNEERGIERERKRAEKMLSDWKAKGGEGNQSFWKAIWSEMMNAVNWECERQKIYRSINV